jgi:hypothetical protein
LFCLPAFLPTTTIIRIGTVGVIVWIVASLDQVIPDIIAIGTEVMVGFTVTAFTTIRMELPLSAPIPIRGGDAKRPDLGRSIQVQ